MSLMALRVVLYLHEPAVPNLGDGAISTWVSWRKTATHNKGEEFLLPTRSMDVSPAIDPKTSSHSLERALHTKYQVHGEPTIARRVQSPIDE